MFSMIILVLEIIQRAANLHRRINELVKTDSMNDISIKDIRSFLAIAKTLNFSRAASELNVSTSALSVAIKDMEARLGCRLFERTTRAVLLTPAGATFIPVAERLSADFAKAIDDLKSYPKTPNGRIAIGAASSIISTVLADAIADLAVEAPQIEVYVLEEITEGITSRVMSGELDFGVTTLWSAIDVLVATPFLQDRLGALISTRHPLAKESGPLEWKNLRQHSIVSLTTSAGIRKQIEQDPVLSEFVQKSSYQVSSIPAICSFVRSGIGTAILPALIAKDLDKKAYMFRPLIRPTVWRNLFLIRSRGHSPSAASLMLIGHLSKRLSLLEKTETIKPNKAFDTAIAADSAL